MKKGNGIVFIICGILFIIVAGGILILSLPLNTTHDVSQYYVKQINAFTSTSEISNDTINKESSVISYGSTSYTQDVVDATNMFLQSILNVGYREVSGNFPDYVSKAKQETSDFNIEVNDNVIPIKTYIQKIGECIVDDQLEINSTFIPEYEFITSDKMYCENGTLSLICKNGNSIKMSNLLGLDDFKNGNIYKIQISIILGKKDGKYIVYDIQKKYKQE